MIKVGRKWGITKKNYLNIVLPLFSCIWIQIYGSSMEWPAYQVRERVERERHHSKKILYPFFHMGELLIDFTACPSICSIFQSEPISNCHDDHRPKSTVEPSLSLKGRDTYILRVGLKNIALTASDRSSPIALVFFYFGARNPKFLAAQKYLVCNI